MRKLIAFRPNQLLNEEFEKTLERLEVPRSELAERACAIGLHVAAQQIELENLQKARRLLERSGRGELTGMRLGWI